MCAGKSIVPGENDLQTLFPEIAAQWYAEKNGMLTPEQVSPYSNRKVWWQCPDGHIWKAVIYSRAGPQETGCPVGAGRVKQSRLERYGRAAAEVGSSFRGHAVPKKLNKRR